MEKIKEGTTTNAAAFAGNDLRPIAANQLSNPEFLVVTVTKAVSCQKIRFDGGSLISARLEGLGPDTQGELTMPISFPLTLSTLPEGAFDITVCQGKLASPILNKKKKEIKPAGTDYSTADLGVLPGCKASKVSTKVLNELAELLANTPVRDTTK
jgi:hypothetical protein